MERIRYIDYLRFFASFAVVFFHVSGSCGIQLELSIRESLVMGLYHNLVTWCVPIFIMISGTLFLSPDREKNFIRLFSHNILHLIIVWSFWSLVYALYQFIIYDDATIKGLIVHLLRGHFHQWFLWLMIGLYMLVPIVRILVSNRKITEYYLILSLVFSFIIPFYLDTLRAFLPVLQPLINIGEVWIDNTQLSNLNGYCFYFVLGYYLHTYINTARAEKFFIVLGILAFLFNELLFYYCHLEDQRISFAVQFISPTVLLESIAVFFIFKKMDCKFSGKCVMSKYSLGIYMIHMLVLYICMSLGFTMTSVPVVFGVPFISIMCFVISMVVIAVLYRIPFINKWII